MGTNYQGSEREQHTLNAFIKFVRAAETINNHLSKHLAEIDLTVSQFGVLEALLHLGPLNQKSLGEKLLKSGGNITLVIDNLEKSGRVERQPDPDDRRSMLVHLTPAGKKFITDYFPQHLTHIMEEFDILSNVELNQLANISKKLGLQKKDNK